MKLPISPAGCPLDALLRVLSGHWTIYILCRLHQNGPTRFGQLKRQIVGISSKMLTERLRTLEKAEILYRDHIPTVPPQVTYGLTKEGQELTTVLDQLNTLAQQWGAETQDSHQQMAS
jgi:DNA-binding HxlR family transcriptional regulator